MALALVAIAWLLVMTGINGNYTAVGNQMQADFPGFVNYLAGIIGIAVFFRLIDMPNAGRVFLILVLVAFLMQNTNVLTQLEAVTGSTSANASANATSATSANAAAATSATAPSTGSGATPLTTPAPGTGSGGIGSA
jgi:uncharacterized membrane protein HdeD (DUF308 family)